MVEKIETRIDSQPPKEAKEQTPEEQGRQEQQEAQEELARLEQSGVKTPEEVARYEDELAKKSQAQLADLEGRLAGLGVPPLRPETKELIFKNNVEGAVGIEQRKIGRHAELVEKISEPDDEKEDESRNEEIKEKEKAPEKKEQKIEIGELGEFDMDYFKSLGGDGWIAIGMENCKNQRYFTVYSDEGEKIGIVGVYDTDVEENISHTVIDPKFRGQGLAQKAKEKLMDKLNLPFLTLTIDLSNTASLRATEKIQGAKKVSDKAYEQDQHKRKYRLERKRG